MHPHLTRFSADLWGSLSASAGFLLFIFSGFDLFDCVSTIACKGIAGVLNR